MNEQRYAVLIGNRLFHTDEPGLPPLRCAVADAEGLADLLGSDTHGPYHVSTLCDQPHTQILQEVFRTLKKASGADVVLIYYSGHGKLGSDGALYLAAENTSLEDLPVTSVPIDLVHRYIEQSQARRVVLILDCCFSGAVDKVFKGGNASEQTQLLLRDFKGRGTYILTACTDIQLAEEKEGDRFSVLTKHIIEGIRDGAADANDDGVVTIHELLQYVQQQVPQDGSQRPQGYAFRAEDGELGIAKTGKPPLGERRNQIRRAIYSAAMEHFIPEPVIRKASAAIEFVPGRASNQWLERLFDLRNHAPAFIEELYAIAANLPAAAGHVQRLEWGFTELRIDETALQEGRIEITGCRGVLPDRTEFDLPAVDRLPEPRSVEEALVASGQDPFGIYLAASPVSAKGSRFRLLMETEEFEDYSALRIVQWKRDADGRTRPDPSHVPPCLDIGASSYLMAMLRRLIEILHTRASSLGVSRRQKNLSLADFNGSEMVTFSLLQTIRTALPELTHISARRGHPEQLFVAMLRLAGALSAFSSDLTLSRLPPYDHQDLGACMSAVDQEIRVLLETVIPSRYIAIPLRPVGKNIWSCTIPEEWLGRDVRFVLAVSTRMPAEQLIRQFPLLAILSTPDFLQRIIERAIPGLTMRYLPIPPPAIPVKLDHQYFELVQSGANWEAIRKFKAIAIQVAAEIPEPTLELVLVR